MEPLPGYKKANSMVFCGIYPLDGGDYENLKDALENAKIRIDMLKVLKTSEVGKQSDIDTNEALLNNYLKELEEQKRKYNK